MKKIFLLLFAVLCVSLCACSAEGSAPSAGATFTDAFGNSVTVGSHERVVSLYGSFAETWLLAGGKLVGATQDAVSERGLVLAEDTAIIGSVKEPNLEEILALEPDFVILSADIVSHAAVGDALRAAGIPCAFFRVDAFDDYLNMLRQFCDMTGRNDLYEQNGTAVKEQIDQVLSSVPKTGDAPRVLLLRAYSTGVKAKAEDNLTGVMLKELGADNIAARHGSLLEELSLETIVAEDPAFIFVITMGSDTDKALDALQEELGSNPAFQNLSAVKDNRLIVLDKDLFHYKPNAKWGKSYEVLADMLYPDRH